MTLGEKENKMKFERILHVFIGLFAGLMFFSMFAASEGFFVLMAFLSVFGLLCMISWVLRVAYLFGCNLKERLNAEQV